MKRRAGSASWSGRMIVIWVVAEKGRHAGYARNLAANPHAPSVFPTPV